MALSATICKAELNVIDMDRHYYQQHSLTIAQHPSETDERLMVRLLAFALHASDSLSFTKGLSTDDEPDLWQKSLSDDIELWIDLGTPDESRIRKASGRAKQVIVYVYGDRSVAVWWTKNEATLKRFNNVRVVQISDESMQALAALASSNMSLQSMIEDGQLALSSTEHEALIEVEMTTLKA